MVRVGVGESLSLKREPQQKGPKLQVHICMVGKVGNMCK